MTDYVHTNLDSIQITTYPRDAGIQVHTYQSSGTGKFINSVTFGQAAMMDSLPLEYCKSLDSLLFLLITPTSTVGVSRVVMDTYRSSSPCSTRLREMCEAQRCVEWLLRRLGGRLLGEGVLGIDQRPIRGRLLKAITNCCVRVCSPYCWTLEII